MRNGAIHQELRDWPVIGSSEYLSRKKLKIQVVRSDTFFMVECEMGYVCFSINGFSQPLARARYEGTSLLIKKNKKLAAAL